MAKIKQIEYYLKDGKKTKKPDVYHTYHLVEKKTGNIIKYFLYGQSPSAVRKKYGSFDKRQYKLVLQV